MTAIQGDVPTAPDSGGGVGVRKARPVESAENAHETRSGQVWPEFSAALLLATTRDPTTPASARVGASGGSVGGNARHQEPSSGQPEPTARAVVARAVEAMTRSQADRVRTIGPGVNLSAIAQAELEGRVAGPPRAEAPSAQVGDLASQSGEDGVNIRAQAGPRSTVASGEAPGVWRAAGEIPQDRPLPNTKPLGENPGVVGRSPSRAEAAASDTVRSLDRLTAAGARAVSSVVPPASSGSMARVVVKPASAPVGAVGSSVGSTTANYAGSGAAGGASAGLSSRWVRGQADAGSRSKQGVGEPFSVQVHRALAQALRAKDGHVTLRLTPEHLGTVRVELRRTEGGTSARFEAATPQARKLLGDSVGELRSVLEARGVKVESISVRLAEPAGADAERGPPSITKPDAPPSQEPTDRGDGPPGRHEASDHQARDRRHDGHAMDGDKQRAHDSDGGPIAGLNEGTDAPGAGWSDDPIQFGLIEVIA